jgi:hypothetical protein
MQSNLILPCPCIYFVCALLCKSTYHNEANSWCHQLFNREKYMTHWWDDTLTMSVIPKFWFGTCRLVWKSSKSANKESKSTKRSHEESGDDDSDSDDSIALPGDSDTQNPKAPVIDIGDEESKLSLCWKGSCKLFILSLTRMASRV